MDILRKKGGNFMKIGMDLGGSHIGIGLVQDGKIIDTIEKVFNR